MNDNNITAPVARKKPVEHTKHGKMWVDNYDWIRVDNWQEVLKDPAKLDSEVRKHLEAENNYTDAVLAPTKDLQEKLYDEYVSRIKQDDSSVPLADGDYEYGYSYSEGKEYPVCYRVARGSGVEDDAKNGDEKEILLDMNELAEGKEFFNFRLNHSHNHNLIAVSVDDKGSEYFDIKVYDIAAKKFTSDLISKTNGYIAWSGDSQYIFYVELDDNHRSVAVHRHAVGTKMSEDVEVYRENDKSFFVNVDNTLSKRFIVINTGEHHTSEVHLIPAAKPENKPKVVEPRQKGVKYTVLDGGDKFFIRTNADGADDYKIVTAPIDEPGAGNWREFVAHTPGRLILHATVFKNHLVRLEQENAVRRIIIHDRATTKEHAVTFADETYALNTQEGYEYDTSNLRFEYSSMRQPNQVFDYNMRTKSRELRKQQEIPAGHDPDQYEIKLLMAPAHDGETIPVSVLYKKGTKLDGSAPCLLYGYGSYGITITPGFRITPLSLVNRGFVYAIAHIRGGRARGENWYQQTRKFGKTKTFYDFISAAHYLVDNDYTSEGAIVAQGGSAGGMLMGAIANINPRLFGGIIANVPFVDVLNTMLDDSLPLTPPEWPEWGNPIARVEEFAMIRSYSPYDNISEQTYPPILATGGLTDPRVTYWEPSKWVAKLREFNRSKSPILLHMNMGAGHSGVSGRFASLKETALEHAFAIFAVGKPLT